ncbi:uncharacterized protein LOC110034905 [Phalaenopsis equestris]|uniref:uncharacterized protein LOC110034905 n=1 Tax=Phalaenopsis equestris TaxID=78828 RepID=UPI0009E3F371|nr:uncharacterized protein LOC110034905 [Phalaenopsis equestris]XP_020594812.1 uncharacterized protein LOC110034905 [Phalaenopsis equestris]XP_020594821.1 uncharacterized protein LOC110034905 [Phalaenopsis equestris]XP_020594827.1 uncharacterized protein LOC110034905 [Phalaenopsis equestris]
MWRSQLWILSLFILLSSSRHAASLRVEEENNSVKTSVFLSPPFVLKHGLVQNKFYFNIPFPRGHIALKSFNAEVVDENGNSIPLHETYLHHWVLERYYGQKAAKEDDLTKIIIVRNSGPCRNIGQYYGLGSETRKTSTWVPDPYGIEIGNPKEVPEGYEEKWLLNVHAIDTRKVEDRLGCTECKCSLYNVTYDEYGRKLANGYVGGLHCCYDETQCRAEEGFGDGGERKLYLRYTVKWIEWSPRILPVKIYILDVTDTGDRPTGLNFVNASYSCKVEYTIPSCDSVGEDNGECVDVRKTKVVLPHGGDIIYGVAHQHTGGVGTALYGEDGRHLCSSNPMYGEGEEAGDEAGYIVGMSTCYPKPGSVNIRDGELLTLVSNYSSLRMHTGVMGLFYILLAEPQPKLSSFFSQELIVPRVADLVEQWWVLLLAGGIMVVVAAAIYSRRKERDGGYQMVVN